MKTRAPPLPLLLLPPLPLHTLNRPCAQNSGKPTQHPGFLSSCSHFADLRPAGVLLVLPSHTSGGPSPRAPTPVLGSQASQASAPVLPGARLCPLLLLSLGRTLATCHEGDIFSPSTPGTEASRDSRPGAAMAGLGPLHFCPLPSTGPSTTWS